MPGVDGFELASLIQRLDYAYKSRLCPIIAVTAYVSNEIVLKAK